MKRNDQEVVLDSEGKPFKETEKFPSPFSPEELGGLLSADLSGLGPIPSSSSSLSQDELESVLEVMAGDLWESKISVNPNHLTT